MFNKLNSKVLIGKATISQNDFDGRYFSLELKEDDKSIKGVITAKCDLTFKSFFLEAEKDFDDNDLFYANGYQSWTTSREYDKNYTVNDLMTLGKKLGGLPEFCCGISGDYSFDFIKYGVKGLFHSYTYTYFRKKGDMNITLYGSKSERKGYTVFKADMQNNKFILLKDLDGLTLSKGETYEVFDIAVIKGEYDKAFDEYFFDFCGFKKPKISHLAGYTSWYNYFSKVTEDICVRDLQGMDEKGGSCTNIFQIDDGYQTATGDWLSTDPKKFPNGMKYLADMIHEKGYLAGIWLAPFCAQLTSTVAKEHPEWLIKEANGKKALCHVGWGGSYALDIYNEGARNYIKHFFDVILNEWGFDMVKLDFLFTQCIKPRGGRTRGEIMCDGVDLLREACGEKLILGCGVPIGPCMGIFDACRIGCDANKVFEGDFVNKLKINNEIPSTQNSMINSIFRRHLDGRAFCNDPDVLFLRDENLKFNKEQKLLLGKVNAVCGNVLFVSDNMGDYNDETVEYLKNFFEEKDYTVISAEFKNATDIELQFTENGERKLLFANLYTGEGNVEEIV